MKPTEKHYDFARFVAEGMTAKDAAIRAGFSESTAEKLAWKWIGLDRSNSQYPELWDRVQDIRGQAVKQAQSVADLSEVLGFLTGVLRADVNKTSEFDGYALSPKSFEDMGDGVKYISEVEFQKGRGVKIKHYSKMDAAKELMKFHGAYEKHNKQKGISTESLLKVLTDEQLSKLAGLTDSDRADGVGE